MREIIRNLANDINKDLEVKSSVDDIYKIHKYWARKPWYVVDKYIEEYSNPGDLIIDPFCGSGLTGSEAISLGRNFLGIDLNPMSILISEGTMNGKCDTESLLDDFKSIELACKNKIMNLYETKVNCPICGKKMFEKHLVCGGKNEGKSSLFCACGKKISGLVDTGINQRNNTLEESYWVPETYMPNEFFKDRFSYKGVKQVKDFFSPRALSSLSFILDTIKKMNSKNENYLLLAFSNTLLHCSKLKGENVRPMSVNNYWLPNDIIDENVWFRFEDRFMNVYNSKVAFNERNINKKVGKYGLINGSALKSNNYKKCDYIFTDPPYGETIQYSELSFVWNAWLEKKYEIEDEVIINPVQKKSTKEFNKLLDYSLTNIYDSLKRGKYFTLCFANKEFNVWREIISHCKQLGFQIERIETYDTYGTPFNKNWATFSPKTDLYVTFKKISKSDKFKTVNQNVTLNNIVDSCLEYFEEINENVNVYKLYDLTIATIIWLMFYNKKDFNIENFDLKSFSKIIEEKEILS